MNADGSALIGSVYDYCWEDALTTDVDMIYFRSITNTETGEVVFVAMPEEGVAANKVYLYRLNEPHTHQFGEWIPSNDRIHHERSCACGATEIEEHKFGECTRSNDSLQRVSPCGAIEIIDIVNITESIPKTIDAIKVEIRADNAIPNGTVLITENLVEQMND